MQSHALESAVLSRDEIETFARDGIVDVRRAFAREQAEAMQRVVWRRLADFGIAVEDRATWSRPFAQLSRVARHRAFAHVLSDRVRGALDQLVGAGRWQPPRNWGGVFVTFPNATPPWPLVADGWHWDNEPLGQDVAVMAFVILADLAPGGGGTLLVGGSPRALARWHRALPVAPPRKMRWRRRQFVVSSPWLADLTTGDPADRERIARLRDRATRTADGDELRVVEVCGDAGDVVLCHPCVLHVTSRNAADRPRLMRIGMVRYAAPWRAVALPPETPVARAIAPLA